MNIVPRREALRSALQRVWPWRRPPSAATDTKGQGLEASENAREVDPVLPALGTRASAFARLATWLRSLDRRARVIGVMIMLCLISTWIALGLVLKASHRQNWDDASASADNVAKLLATEVETNFTLCDQSLQALLSNLSNPAIIGLPPLLRDQATFNSSFNLPIFGSLFVTDKDGIIREHAYAPLTRRIDVADREYFKAQRDHQGVGLFIDHPFISRINGEWMVVASRRIERDGRFDGVVAGGLRLDFLKRLLPKDQPAARQLRRAALRGWHRLDEQHARCRRVGSGLRQACRRIRKRRTIVTRSSDGTQDSGAGTERSRGCRFTTLSACRSRS